MFHVKRQTARAAHLMLLFVILFYITVTACDVEAARLTLSKSRSRMRRAPHHVVSAPVEVVPHVVTSYVEDVSNSLRMLQAVANDPRASPTTADDGDTLELKLIHQTLLMF